MSSLPYTVMCSQSAYSRLFSHLFRYLRSVPEAEYHSPVRIDRDFINQVEPQPLAELEGQGSADGLQPGYEALHHKAAEESVNRRSAVFLMLIGAGYREECSDERKSKLTSRG